MEEDDQEEVNADPEEVKVEEIADIPVEKEAQDEEKSMDKSLSKVNIGNYSSF